jgi:hypothetical protein
MIKKRKIPNLKWTIYLFSEVGLVFIPISLVFFIPLYFALQPVDFGEIFYLNQNSPTVSGTLTKIEETDNAGEKSYFYRFELNNSEFQGTSYSQESLKYKTGDNIKVQYNSQKPEINRLLGMSNTSKNFIPGVAILITILCILPFILLFIGLRKGQKLYKLAKKGLLTIGELKILNEQKMRNSDKAFPKLQYTFVANNKDYGTEIYSSNNWSKLDPYNLPNKNLVLYLEDNPSKSIVINDLPKKIQRILIEEYETGNK